MAKMNPEIQAICMPSAQWASLSTVLQERSRLTLNAIVPNSTLCKRMWQVAAILGFAEGKKQPDLLSAAGLLTI
jgi:hypothetical protein